MQFRNLCNLKIEANARLHAEQRLYGAYPGKVAKGITRGVALQVFQAHPPATTYHLSQVGDGTCTTGIHVASMNH